MYKQIKGENRTCQEVDFDNMTDQLYTDCLDKYESFQVKIHQVSQFHESSDISKTYLSKVNTSEENVLKAQEHFPLTDQSTTIRTLLDGTDCSQVILNYI